MFAFSQMVSHAYFCLHRCVVRYTLIERQMHEHLKRMRSDKSWAFFLFFLSLSLELLIMSCRSLNVKSAHFYFFNLKKLYTPLFWLQRVSVQKIVQNSRKFSQTSCPISCPLPPHTMALSLLASFPRHFPSR